MLPIQFRTCNDCKNRLKNVNNKNCLPQRLAVPQPRVHQSGPQQGCGLPRLQLAGSSSLRRRASPRACPASSSSALCPEARQETRLPGLALSSSLPPGLAGGSGSRSWRASLAARRSERLSMSGDLGLVSCLAPGQRSVREETGLAQGAGGGNFFNFLNKFLQSLQVRNWICNTPVMSYYKEALVLRKFSKNPTIFFLHRICFRPF